MANPINVEERLIIDVATAALERIAENTSLDLLANNPVVARQALRIISEIVNLQGDQLN